jgi:hypothetical protein
MLALGSRSPASVMGRTTRLAPAPCAARRRAVLLRRRRRSRRLATRGRHARSRVPLARVRDGTNDSARARSLRCPPASRAPAQTSTKQEARNSRQACSLSGPARPRPRRYERLGSRPLTALPAGEPSSGADVNEAGRRAARGRHARSRVPLARARDGTNDSARARSLRCRPVSRAPAQTSTKQDGAPMGGAASGPELDVGRPEEPATGTHERARPSEAVPGTMSHERARPSEAVPGTMSHERARPSEAVLASQFSVQVGLTQ